MDDTVRIKAGYHTTIELDTWVSATMRPKGVYMVLVRRDDSGRSVGTLITKAQGKKLVTALNKILKKK